MRFCKRAVALSAAMLVLLASSSMYGHEPSSTMYNYDFSPIQIPDTPTPEPSTPDPTQEIKKSTPSPFPLDIRWSLDANISWYGPGFYGNRTACGLRLTKTLVGVAHRTLKCGTVVYFKWHGNIVKATVVDRGPYVKGRQFDLTRGLCMKLDHCYTGKIYFHIGE